MNPKYQKNSRRNDRPRNEDFEFPLVGNFYSRSDMEMDANQIYGVLSDLNDQKVFSTISIYTQIKRSDLTKDPEKKGFMNVGFIRSYNADDGTMSVTVYGNHVSAIKEILDTNDIFISPRIISDRNGDFQSFTTFDMKVVPFGKALDGSDQPEE